MNWKNRFTNYNFWISIVSAILLICQAFKIEFDVAYVNEIATAVLGLLVVIGIISDPTKIATKQNQITKKDVSSSPELEKTVEEKMESIENATKEKGEEKEVEKTSALEDISIPTDSADENASNNIENNLQTIVEKISLDLKEENEKTDKVEKNILDLIKELITNEQNIQNDEIKADENQNPNIDENDIQKDFEENENKEMLEDDKTSTLTLDNKKNENEVVFKIVND